MKNKVITLTILFCLLMPFMFVLSGCNKIKIEVYIDNVLVETLTTSKKENYKINIPNTPTKNSNDESIEYLFSGWFIDENYEIPLTNDTTFTENSKIYGKWSTITIDIFNYNVVNEKIVITSFNNKHNKENIVIPSSINSIPVDTIGENAFLNQTTIKSITLSEGITTIKNSSFSGCSLLEEVILPSSLKTIESSSFANCENLKTITLPKNVINLEKNVFLNSNLESLYYQGEMKDWINNNLGKSEILLKIDDFYINNSLIENTLTIESNIDIITAYAFYGLKSIKTLITNNATEIKEYAFANCYNLKELKLDNLEIIGNNSFENCISLINPVVAKSVIHISKETFKGCFNIESISIPFVGQQENYDENLEDFHFGFIFSTESFTNSIQVLPKYEGQEIYYIPKNLKKVEISVSYRISSCVFYNCTNLESIIFSENMKIIGNSAFENCTGLKKLVLPESLTNLSSRAFKNCTGLEYVVMPSNTNIYLGNNCPFEDCNGLTIYFKSTQLPSDWRYTKWLVYNFKMYFYSENTPVTEGDFWHYVNNKITIWEK